MFSRSQLGQNLTPEERAILRLIKSFLVTGGLALIPLLVQLEQNIIAGGIGTINWSQEIDLLVFAFLVALLQAIAKYFSAQGDLPLASAADTAANALQAKEPQHAAAETIPAPSLWSPDPGLTTMLPKISTTKAAAQDMPNISAI